MAAHDGGNYLHTYTLQLHPLASAGLSVIQLYCSPGTYRSHSREEAFQSSAELTVSQGFFYERAPSALDPPTVYERGLIMLLWCFSLRLRVVSVCVRRDSTILRREVWRDKGFIFRDFVIPQRVSRSFRARVYICDGYDARFRKVDEPRAWFYWVADGLWCTGVELLINC